MIDPGTMNATTEHPAPKEGSGGFPPFDTSTFPSQIFWLVVTFAFLFVVVWRVAGPRISGVITTRRNKINGDIAEAQKHRSDAEAASATAEQAAEGLPDPLQERIEVRRRSLAAAIVAPRVALLAAAGFVPCHCCTLVRRGRTRTREHARDSIIARTLRSRGNRGPERRGARRQCGVAEGL